MGMLELTSKMKGVIDKARVSRAPQLMLMNPMLLIIMMKNMLIMSKMRMIRKNLLTITTQNTCAHQQSQIGQLVSVQM